MNNSGKKSGKKRRRGPRNGFAVIYQGFLARCCGDEEEAKKQADEFWRSLSPEEKAKRNEQAKANCQAIHPSKPMETPEQKAQREAQTRVTRTERRARQRKHRKARGEEPKQVVYITESDLSEEEDEDEFDYGAPGYKPFFGPPTRKDDHGGDGSGAAGAGAMITM